MLELATAMVLLAGAGLLGQSLYRLLHVEIGVRPDHLVTMDVYAPNETYGKNPQAIALARLVTGRVEDTARRHFGCCRGKWRPPQWQRQHHLVPRAGPALAWRTQ